MITVLRESANRLSDAIISCVQPFFKARAFQTRSRFAVVLIAAFAACTQPASTDPNAPEPGTYTGSNTVSSLTVDPARDKLDPALYGVTSSGAGSVFGDLVLNSNGTYKLTNGNESGRWRYDPATQCVAFTGRFSQSQITCRSSDVSQSILVAFPYDGSTIQSTFSKRRTTPVTIENKPTTIATGHLLIDRGDGLVQDIDVATGRAIGSFRGHRPNRGASGWSAMLIAGRGLPDIAVYDPAGKPAYTLTGDAVFKAGALTRIERAAVSPDGARVVLSGWHSGNWNVMPSNVHVIVDRNHQVLKRFETGTQQVWMANWTRDGRLVFNGHDSLMLYNPADDSERPLSDVPINTARVSADGGQLLMSADSFLDVLDLQSGRISPWAEGRFADLLRAYAIRDLSWSPDQASVALSVQSRQIEFTGHRVLILTEDGASGFLQDENGEPMSTGGGSPDW